MKAQSRCDIAFHLILVTGSSCLNKQLVSFRSEVANFDAVISHVPSLPEEKQLPTYVGRYYIIPLSGLYIYCTS